MKFFKCITKKFFIFNINAITFYFAVLCSFFSINYILDKQLTTTAYQTDIITYAKANSDCALYKTQTMNNAISNIYFYIPNTYFVSIISKINDNSYRVQYDNYVGYVFADKIDIVSFMPTNPTLSNVTFDILQNTGTQIWSLPSDSEGIILTTISADTKNIEYIASTIGEIPIGGTTNVWYYAKFTPASSTTSVYEGYVYSEATTNLSHIANNLEYEPEHYDLTDNKKISISNVSQIIMIVFICLPFLILLILATIKIIAVLKIKYKKQPTPENQIQNEITLSPKQFVRKKTTNNSVEVIFPEYNYIDDDDLL